MAAPTGFEPVFQSRSPLSPWSRVATTYECPRTGETRTFTCRTREPLEAWSWRYKATRWPAPPRQGEYAPGMSSHYHPALDRFPASVPGLPSLLPEADGVGHPSLGTRACAEPEAMTEISELVILDQRTCLCEGPRSAVPCSRQAQCHLAHRRPQRWEAHRTNSLNARCRPSRRRTALEGSHLQTLQPRVRPIVAAILAPAELPHTE